MAELATGTHATHDADERARRQDRLQRAVHGWRARKVVEGGVDPRAQEHAQQQTHREHKGDNDGDGRSAYAG